MAVREHRVRLKVKKVLVEKTYDTLFVRTVPCHARFVLFYVPSGVLPGVGCVVDVA